MGKGIRFFAMTVSAALLCAAGLAWATEAADREPADDCPVSGLATADFEALYRSDSADALLLGALLARSTFYNPCAAGEEGPAGEQAQPKQEAACCPGGPVTTVYSAGDFAARAFAVAPDNAAVLRYVVESCRPGDGVPRGATCPDALEDRLLQVDPDNGLSWMLQGVAAYRAGHTGAALRALARVVELDTFSSHFAEQALGFADATATYLPDYATGSVAFAAGLAAGNLPRYQSMFEMCKAEAAGQAQWLSTCLAVGQQMETRGEDILSSAVGLELQREMYELVGAQDKKTEVAKRSQALREPPLRAAEAGRLTDPYDDRAVRVFLEDAAKYGERQALLRLVKSGAAES
ncbi:MAG: hypothetical protein ACK5HY_07210 [Parahaliea sp.]